MKKLTTAALLVGGAILASQSAFAQFVDNDLYLGFQNSAGGGTADYIINLGPASGIVGQSYINLSSDFSLSDFDAVLGASSSMLGGVIGASNGQTPSDVYGTQLRTSNIGDPALAGSSAPNGPLTTAQDTTVAQKLSTLYSPAAGTGGLDSGKSWEALVEPTLTLNSYYGTAGFNPDSAVSPSTVLYEDLWETSDLASGSRDQGHPFVYLGYFTLNLTGSNPSLTFQAVPEPTVLGLLGGAGLLLVTLRRRSNNQKA